MPFVTPPNNGEFINYPLGSQDYYGFPISSVEEPEGEYFTLVLADGRRVSVPVGLQVRVSRPAFVGGPYWFDISEVSRLLQQETGIGLYVLVVDIADPEVFTPVEAEAVTGMKAEKTPAVYSVLTTHYMRVSELIPNGYSIAHTTQVATRPIPVGPDCSCLLTNDPCGERMAFVLTPPTF